jgi:hypothetical protein
MATVTAKASDSISILSFSSRDRLPGSSGSMQRSQSCGRYIRPCAALSPTNLTGRSGGCWHAAKTKPRPGVDRTGAAFHETQHQVQRILNPDRLRWCAPPGFGLPRTGREHGQAVPHRALDTVPEKFIGPKIPRDPGAGSVFTGLQLSALILAMVLSINRTSRAKIPL